MSTGGSSRDWLDNIERDLCAHLGGSEVVAQVVLDPLHIQRFVVTCGIPTGPVESAAADGLLEAPPMYLPVLFGWTAGPPNGDLRQDGLASEDAIAVDLRGGRVLGAGQSAEFLRPAFAGSRVTVSREIESVERKQGRQGHFLLVTVRRDFADAAGELYSTSRERFIVRPDRD